MSVTKEELASFQQFAEQIVDNGGAESIEELLRRWHAELEYREIEDAVSQGLEDIENGRGQPVRDFLDELKHPIKLA